MRIICSAGKGEMESPECLNCALVQAAEYGKPPCGYDYALLRALFSDSETERRRSEIHVTDLTGCTRKAWYDKCHPSPERPHDILVRWLGTHVHESMETSDAILESELPLAHQGILGRSDIVYKNGRLVDIKTTRWLKPSNLPYGSHALQVNIYAWMLRNQQENRREIDRLQILYIDLSGPTKCRRCKRTVQMISGSLKCPECLQEPTDAHLGALVFDVPLMTDEEVEMQILDRKEELTASIELDSPPEKEPGFLCGYCAHMEKCNPESRE